MKSQDELDRETCRMAYRAAHLSGCIAALFAAALLAPAKISGLLPPGMGWLRIILILPLAYGLVAAARLWNLGRAAKRANAMTEAALNSRAESHSLGNVTTAG